MPDVFAIRSPFVDVQTTFVRFGRRVCWRVCVQAGFVRFDIAADSKDQLLVTLTIIIEGLAYAERPVLVAWLFRLLWL